MADLYPATSGRSFGARASDHQVVVFARRVVTMTAARKHRTTLRLPREMSIAAQRAFQAVIDGAAGMDEEGEVEAAEVVRRASALVAGQILSALQKHY